MDGLFRRVEERGGITISAADGINEIGFGKIDDAVAEAVDWATRCRCGCGRGVLCSTPVTHLYPTAISNWGAYALVGAVALYSGDPNRLHTPEVESDLERLAMEYDVRDGTTGRAGLSHGRRAAGGDSGDADDDALPGGGLVARVHPTILMSKPESTDGQGWTA